MDLSYQEKGEYFRGLLILIGKDNIINGNEKTKILEIGQKIGFNKSFCDDAVTNFLENKFISLEPPKFSSQQITEHFLDDAIKLSLIDNEFHTEELEWLEKIAIENDIDNRILDLKIKQQALNFKSANSINTP